MTLIMKAFENIVGKGENACNRSAFLLFTQCFLHVPVKDKNNHFSKIKFVICKCFQFGEGQNSVVWNTAS